MLENCNFCRIVAKTQTIDISETVLLLVETTINPASSTEKA